VNAFERTIVLLAATRQGEQAAQLIERLDDPSRCRTALEQLRALPRDKRVRHLAREARELFAIESASPLETAATSPGWRSWLRRLAVAERER
jgi:hypothetical protein